MRRHLWSVALIAVAGFCAIPLPAVAVATCPADGFCFDESVEGSLRTFKPANVTASIKVQDQTPVAGEEWTIQIVVSFFEGIPAGGSFAPLVLLEPGFLDPLAGVSDAIVNGSIEFNDESNFLVMQF